MKKIKSCNNCGKPFLETINLGKHPCADTFVKSKKIISTANSATGLGNNNNISLFEGPHTGKNFLTTEMINKIKKEKANFLRLCFVILTCILPIYMIIQEASLIIDNFILKVSFFLVLIFALIGMLIERYLFFIQAKHVVSLYYGEKKV